ncbi:MAG: hypothetical protein ACO1PZ_14900 [Gammaproteobacteria bacterium]
MQTKQTISSEKRLELLMAAGIWLPANPQFRELFGDKVKAALMHGSKHGDLSLLDSLVASIPSELERDQIKAKICERFDMLLKPPKSNFGFATPDARKLLPRNHRGLFECYTLLKDCKGTLGEEAVQLAREDLSLSEFIAFFLDTLTLFRDKVTPLQLDEIENIVTLLRKRHQQDQHTDASTG